MVYIVTPCSRPENLNQIFNSIFGSIPKEMHHYYRWCIVFDKSVQKIDMENQINEFNNLYWLAICSPILKAFVGHAHRNVFLESFIKFDESDGKPNWCYFLDDDTLLHPNFHKYVFPELTNDSNAVIFDQINKDGNYRLAANIEKIKVCHIDMGQYVINLDQLPKGFLFKEDDYCADGIFIEELFNMTEDKSTFKIINQPCSIYNALR